MKRLLLDIRADLTKIVFGAFLACLILGGACVVVSFFASGVGSALLVLLVLAFPLILAIGCLGIGVLMLGAAKAAALADARAASRKAAQAIRSEQCAEVLPAAAPHGRGNEPFAL